MNIVGYIEQFKENNVQDVIDALCEDWMKASDVKKDAMEKNLLERNTQSWERHIKEWGLSDYKRRKRIDKTYHRYPALQEIVKTSVENNHNVRMRKMILHINIFLYCYQLQQRP